MAITIEEAGTGLKELIDDITILKQVFAPNELSMSPNVFPCALIIPGPVNYLEAFNSKASTTFRILVLHCPIDSKVGMDTILPLREKSGDSSIFAKVNTDPTLGGHAETSVVRSCSEIKTEDWGTGNYLSTEFEVAVWL
jgi:hypothetical protein